MIRGGYQGKILRVDLSLEKVEEERLPGENILRKYVGGTGLGLKYLYDLVPPSMDPLDPGSPLIFMNWGHPFQDGVSMAASACEVRRWRRIARGRPC